MVSEIQGHAFGGQTKGGPHLFRQRSAVIVSERVNDTRLSLTTSCIDVSIGDTKKYRFPDVSTVLIREWHVTIVQQLLKCECMCGMLPISVHHKRSCTPRASIDHSILGCDGVTEAVRRQCVDSRATRNYRKRIRGSWRALGWPAAPKSRSARSYNSVAGGYLITLCVSCVPRVVFNGCKHAGLALDVNTELRRTSMGMDCCWIRGQAASLGWAVTSSMVGWAIDPGPGRPLTAMIKSE
jgi:hypothetical protein